MPLVFVHGVNVREGSAYSKELLQRNLYLSNIFLKLLGRNVAPENIHCPYWGDLATNTSPGNPFLPTFATPTSTTKKLLNHLLRSDESASSKFSLLQLARKQPIEEVVDLIVAAAAESDLSESSDAAEQLTDFAYDALKFSRQFSSLEEQLDWLEGMNEDSQLLEKLEEEIAEMNQRELPQGQEAQAKAQKARGMKRIRGAVSWMHEHWQETRSAIKEDVGKVSQKTVERARDDLRKLRTTASKGIRTIAAARRRTTTHITAAAITHPLRKIVHDRLFLFIGDAFLYFGQRGTPDNPGLIPRRIMDTIDSATKTIDPVHDPELIVMAHSMGGNIVCDVLSYFATDRPIDLLITVGSQFPLFADLHMFPGLDSRNQPIPKPANIKRWINIYDVNDVFGFAASPMFQDIEDVEFMSGRFGIATHADCFKFVSLYERMAEAVLAPTRYAN